MRLTTRQTVQLHGVIKSNLKATLKTIDEVLAQFDRGLRRYQSQCHVQRAAGAVARACGGDRTWRARSPTICCRTHRPIARSGSMASGSRAARRGGCEPIYGKTYLPRKFKIVVAVPPSNDVDVFAHDLGYIAITDDARRCCRLERHRRRWHGHDPWRARIPIRASADVMGFCRQRRRREDCRGRRHRAA